MICVSLGNIGFQEALKISQRVGMVEVRGDLLSWTREEYALILASANKSVFTYRLSGLKTEKEVLEMYKFAIDNGADYIDTEMEASPGFLKSIREYLEGSDTEFIVSYHNFEKTPSVAEMKVITGQCQHLGADVVKIATMVNEFSDAAALLSLYREAGRKIILGMGEKGRIVRIASLFLGAEFGFVSPDEGGKTAPGQLSLREMEQIINVIKI